MENYGEILQRLLEQWVDVESHHKISKVASNELWRIADKFFHQLYLAKGNRGKRVPQLAHLRRKLNADKLPPVHLKIAYQSKESGEVTVVDSESTPISRFPPSTYRRLYEIAFVKVKTKINFFTFFWYEKIWSR